jgi:hypothetical protein
VGTEELSPVEGEEQERPAAVVVRLAGKEWVAGCVWMSQHRTMTAAEIAEEAAHLGANFYVLRKPHQAGVVGEAARHDVGYGLLPGVSRGMYFSLGAALAELRNDKWSGTFELGEGQFLYVAVVDGSIDASEHGEVVGDRTTIDRAVAAQAWNKLPHKEYSLAELEQILLDAGGRPARVLFLGSRHASVKRLGGAIAATVVLIGGATVAIHIHNQHQAAARARLAALLRQQRAEAARQNAATNPLLALPAPGVLLEACARIARTIPLSDNGWMPQSFQCAPHSVTIVWHATPQAWYAGRPAGVLSMDGQSVVWTGPLRLPNGPQAAIPLPLSVGALLDLGRSAGIDVQLRSEQAPALPGAAVPTPSAPTAPTEGFELRTKWAPWSVPLGQIPGLRIQSIANSGGEWSVKGSLYGAR